MNIFKHRPSYLSVVICAALSGTAMSSFADEQLLDTINVVADKQVTRRSQEATGLGKAVKTAAEISEKQILSVRDLVRDTPGVAVVEQGRGASSGYTIRGMDKNRVAVTVDGLNQAQSYLVQKRQIEGDREGSGAINEIELENVSAVQISQGASGTESGSGALGGAVGFRTKTVQDVLVEGQKFGISYKGAYSSRDEQIMNSFGLAFNNGTADLLLQYTDRAKSEVQPHQDILDTQYTVFRWASTPADFRNGHFTHKTNGSGKTYDFVLKEECPSYSKKGNAINGCAKKHQILSKPIKETMSATDYTGKDRVLSDPMDYDSDSYLIKAGANLKANHRVEAVYEGTVQRYDSRDMTKEAYHLVDTINKKGGALNGSNRSTGIYSGQNYHEAFVLPNGTGAQYAQARFIDEKHNKTRWGLSYQFKNNDSSGWVDQANFKYDQQLVNINNFDQDKACSIYPIVDKNCTPTIDKPNSSERTYRTIYGERHHLIRLDLSKTINHKNISHNLVTDIGLDKFTSNRTISDIYQKEYRPPVANNAENRRDHKPDFTSVNGSGADLYEKQQQQLFFTDVCKDQQFGLGESRKCGSSIITGHNLYAALKDTIYFGEVADLSLGLRYDYHNFDSKDDVHKPNPYGEKTGKGKYSNTSWNIGLAARPKNNVEMLYRISSGYRVPSFKELFGFRLDGQSYTESCPYETGNVRAEKALNQEVGVNFIGEIGNVEISYFNNSYKDLIDLTVKSYPVANAPDCKSWQYRNYQDVHLDGFSIGGKLYFDALSNKFPAGLTGRVAFLNTNVISNTIKGVFESADGYFLDTITPTRYVFGLDYEAADDKWGSSATLTITGAKDANELKTQAQAPDGSTFERTATKSRSRGWYTLDLSAFYRPNRYLTVRASINNALNHRYSTNEALRQTSVTSGNRHRLGSLNQYAAAGRNFVFSMEMKF